MGQAKRIGIQVKNIYKLEVDGCTAMMGKAENMVTRMRANYGTCNWAIFIMGPSKVMQKISIGPPMGKIA